MANIQSLPNELLEDILHIACGDQLPTPHWQQLQLSQVNQRFREVIINDARLWTHITFKSSVEWVELLLGRSGRYGLIIDLSNHHHIAKFFKRCACPDMLSRVYEHRDRWEEVRFGAIFLPKEHEKIHSLLNTITLPSLRRLTFREDEKAWSTTEGDLCLSWKMPALEQLQCSKDNRHLLHELSIPLKSLRYTEHIGWTTEMAAVHDLIKAKSVIGVEELTLRFALLLTRTADFVYTAVRMENLRSFTVEILAGVFNKAAEFFECLDLPALEVFNFKHDRSETFSKDNSSDDDLLQPYLHSLKWLLVDYHNIQTKYPRLKEVRITIDGFKDEKLCDTLRDKLDEKFRVEWFGGDLGRRVKKSTLRLSQMRHGFTSTYVQDLI